MNLLINDADSLFLYSDLDSLEISLISVISNASVVSSNNRTGNH